MRTCLTHLRLFMTADAAGGVFQYALDLAAGLAAAGVEITLAIFGPAMNASQRGQTRALRGVRVIETGLAIEWLATSEADVIRAAAAAADLACSCRADAVHLNSPALAIARYDVPAVAVAHSCLASWWAAVKGTALPEDFRWRTAFFSRGLEAANLVVCPSLAFARVLNAIYGRTAVAVHNGRSSEGAGAGLAAPAPFAFTAGRLWDEGKDVATLDAAAGLTNVPLYAAGAEEGPNGARIELRHAQALGMLSEADLRAQLARRPIFACASLYEPFGLSVLEAAQAGCALVLSGIPTFRELWQGTALFAAVREPHCFARAIARLQADPPLRAALGRAAQARAKAYSAEAMTQRMLGIYSALLGLREARRGAAA
jgi:glycosyltransferase involved in cell wall biosynthesis